MVDNGTCKEERAESLEGNFCLKRGSKVLAGDPLLTASARWFMFPAIQETSRSKSVYFCPMANIFVSLLACGSGFENLLYQPTAEELSPWQYTLGCQPPFVGFILKCNAVAKKLTTTAANSSTLMLIFSFFYELGYVF